MRNEDFLSFYNQVDGPTRRCLWVSSRGSDAILAIQFLVAALKVS